MTLTKTQKTVVVVGGGYAGVLAANRLAAKARGRARVVLVSVGDSLVERIRLHEAATHGRYVSRALDALLHQHVERIDAKLVGLEAAGRAITIERASGSAQLTYDALILAMGSRMASSLPASSEHAFALASEAQAHALARALPALPRGAHVAVVGGGLTAIELASEIAETYPALAVGMYTSELAPALAGPARDAIARALREAGVTIHTGQRVSALDSDGVRMTDGSLVLAAVSVLAAGFQPTALPPELGLPQDSHGRVPVDEALRVAGMEGVFVAGDLAAPPARCAGSGLLGARMGCATALPQGAHAADQALRMLDGQAPKPYHFDYAAQCISVGRKRGVIVWVDADDKPTGKLVTGRAGAVLKELVCKFVMGALRLERLFGGLYSWPGKSGARALPLPSAKVNHLPS